MKKIVINTCYGGFGLSNKALKRYAELNGKTAYFFIYEFGKYTSFDVNVDTDGFGVCFYVPNPNEILKPEKTWNKLSKLEREAYNKKYREICLSPSDIPRDDVNLIKVVNELKEDANGPFADLKIIQIPDDVDWEIDECDGDECVREKHRTWC
jgi:hypothetical protein